MHSATCFAPRSLAGSHRRPPAAKTKRRRRPTHRPTEKTLLGHGSYSTGRSPTNRAVAHYKAAKEPGLADFGSQGKYVDGEIYVYVVSTSGVFLASGKPLFREILAKARSGAPGTTEYRWLNPVDNKVELKIAHFQKVGDRIIVVGHYVAHGTPVQAQALLARAADALHASAADAIAAFNTRRGPCSEDDLYVWVVSLNDHRFLANGADSRLIGTDALSLRDPSGKPFTHELIAAAEERDRVEGDYLWPSPVTGNIERKHVFVRKIDGMLVGVGYYAR